MTQEEFEEFYESSPLSDFISGTDYEIDYGMLFKFTEACAEQQPTIDLEKVFQYIEQLANEMGIEETPALMAVARIQCKDYLNQKK